MVRDPSGSKVQEKENDRRRMWRKPKESKFEHFCLNILFVSKKKSEGEVQECYDIA